MENYIALLRGINVGGNNTVSMSVLRAAFKEAGFCDVSTYINSGNVFFSSDDASIEILQSRCQQIIAETFKLDIPVAVVSPKALAAALSNAPKWWDKDKELKHNAIFVIPPATVDDIIKEVGEINHEYEQAAHHGQIVFWSAPLKYFSKTKWSKFVSTSACSRVTIRNANTTKKLLQFSDKTEFGKD